MLEEWWAAELEPDPPGLAENYLLTQHVGARALTS